MLFSLYEPAEDLDDFKRFYRELWKGNGKGTDDPFRKAQTERSKLFLLICKSIPKVFKGLAIWEIC